MIESIRFKNFKVLQDATLPLGRFTLLVGPNGSGKSTALQAFEAAAQCPPFHTVARSDFKKYATVGTPEGGDTVELAVNWAADGAIASSRIVWNVSQVTRQELDPQGNPLAHRNSAP